MKYISLVLVLIVVCPILGYVVLRKLKGDLEIKINKTDFIATETIIGQIKLKAKKQIESNKIILKLIKEEYVQHGKYGNWEELF